MTLSETIEKYHGHLLDDMQIIERFIIENDKEIEAIDIISKLAHRNSEKNAAKAKYVAETQTYIDAILDNQFNKEDIVILHRLCTIFARYRDLTKEELDEAARIFDENNVKCCWYVFYAYLLQEGKINAACHVTDLDIIDIERAKKMRGQ